MLVKGYMYKAGGVEMLAAVDAIGNVWLNLHKDVPEENYHFDKPGRRWYKSETAGFLALKGQLEFIGNYAVPRQFR